MAKYSNHQNVIRSLVILFITAGFFQLGYAQPSFSKTFSPNTIGPGSTSTLIFTITNGSGSPITSLTFTDNLPAGVLIATPAVASTDCGGVLTAPNGGSVISFSGGSITANSSCAISVNVVSNTLGTHTNISGDLTSSAGNSGTASDELMVTTDRPGFTKSFSPQTVDLGETSNLIFTVDNTANSSPVTSLNFSDNLPTGMVIANPSNAFTNCFTAPFSANLTANSASDLITFSSLGTAANPVVGANASCLISVDVLTTGIGQLENTTGDATATVNNTTFSIGKAGDILTVIRDDLHIQKTFMDDPVPPGGTVNLQFTITNFDRDFSATTISFTDDLNAALTNMTAIGLPINDVCGPGSSISGTSLLTLTGGNLGAGLSCTFNVPVQIPAGAAPGTYTNTTSMVTAQVDNNTREGNEASAPLFVSPTPIFSKSFLDDPVVPGGMVELEFSITNTSSTSSLTDISFTDELTTFIGFPISATLPPAGSVCNGGTLTIVSCGTECETLSFSEGSLSPDATCSFSTTIDIPSDQPGGTYLNTTSMITGMIQGDAVSGNPAEDQLQVASAPKITKEFTNDPIQPGDPVQLLFTINLSGNATTNATNISFTDDLNATLAGMTLTSVAANDCGGAVGGAGTGNLSFTGGSLAPGSTCTILTTLSTPPASPNGVYPNTTSNITAVESGLNVTGSPASDDLTIAPILFSKEFIDDPVIAGGTTTLRFTIENTSADAITNMSFTDDLESDIMGIMATGLPANNVCGNGSQVSGTTIISFTNGTLGANSMCTFDISLQIPGGTPDGIYNNTTSSLSADIGGSTLTIPPATDLLEVKSKVLQMVKEYTSDPVDPGVNTSLQFTITNLDPSNSVTDISFSDNLSASLSGLAATGLPINNVCGAGSQIAGTNIITLTGGSLNPGASCMFSVTVSVPANAPRGSFNTNITSALSGEVNGLAVNGDPATDDLKILSIIPDCTDNILNINDQILGTTMATDSFHAIDQIIASGTVTSNRNLTFKAGNNIEFLTSFTVNAGAILTNIIENCPN